MGKKPDDDIDLRSTIKDSDWQDLKDRASKANPDAWKLTADPQEVQRRRNAQASFENRENN